MNFSAPRIAGPAARMRRKTPGGRPEERSRRASPRRPTTAPAATESGADRRRTTRATAATAASAAIIVTRRKPNVVESERTQPTYATTARPIGRDRSAASRRLPKKERSSGRTARPSELGREGPCQNVPHEVRSIVDDPAARKRRRPRPGRASRGPGVKRGRGETAAVSDRIPFRARADARDARRRAVRPAGLGLRGEIRRLPDPRVQGGSAGATLLSQRQGSDGFVSRHRRGARAACGIARCCSTARRSCSTAGGVSRFQLLQRGGETSLAVFDCLYRDGRDLRREPLPVRRREAKAALATAPAAAVSLAPFRGGRHRGLPRGGAARLRGARRQERLVALRGAPESRMAQGQGPPGGGARRSEASRRRAARGRTSARCCSARTGGASSSTSARSAPGSPGRRSPASPGRSVPSSAPALRSPRRRGKRAPSGSRRASWRRSRSRSGPRTQSCASPSTSACGTTSVRRTAACPPGSADPAVLRPFSAAC